MDDDERKDETRRTPQQTPCASTEGMLELDPFVANDRGATTAPASPSASADEEDDDDDSDSSHDGEGISSSYAPGHPPRTQPSPRTHFLGRAFHPRTDQIAMMAFQRSLYWFTYRRDLAVPLRPHGAPRAQVLVGSLAHGGGLGGATGEGGMRTDAGWGCMLRSAQMLMAQAVRRHYGVGEEGAAAAAATAATRSRGFRGPSTGSHAGARNGRRREDPWEVERIAQWFADFPDHVTDSESTVRDTAIAAEGDDDDGEGDCSLGKGGIGHHWYSLHQMVAAGLGLGVLPGEWYGPTTACHVLRELNELHCARREQLAERLRSARGEGGDGGEAEGHDGDSGKGLRDGTCDVFRVHVANEGCIYLDAISKLMTQSNSEDGDDALPPNECGDNDGWSTVDRDPLSTDDPLRPQSPPQHEPPPRWDTSLLLLLPLRLGLRAIAAADHGVALARLLSLPHSVGMLGGTPRHALWFYGADAAGPPADGGDAGGGGWYGLDPHVVQAAPRGARVPVDARDAADGTAGDPAPAPGYRWQVQLTDAYLRSLHPSPATSHPNHARAIPLSELDPSCALGFYVRDPRDLARFVELVQPPEEGRPRGRRLPEIVTVRDTTPDYAGGWGREEEPGADLDGFSMRSEDEHTAQEEDDDDDFVLI